MEVNLNPSLNCDSQLDLKVKSKLLTDIFNIIGAIPFSHDGKFIPMDKPNEYKDEIQELTSELCRKCDATLVRIIGFTAILFRPKEEEKEE